VKNIFSFLTLPDASWWAAGDLKLELKTAQINLYHLTFSHKNFVSRGELRR
jgi:hypothetical protein